MPHEYFHRVSAHTYIHPARRNFICTRRKGIVISSYRSTVTRLQRNQRKRRGRLRRFRRGVERKLFQLDFRFGHVHHLPPPSSPVKNAASGLRNDPHCASTSSSNPPFGRHPSKIYKSTSKSIAQGLHAEDKLNHETALTTHDTLVL